jgi:hypothetical protein
MRRVAGSLALALALAVGAMAAPGASAQGGEETVWLCFPGAEPNPCRDSLETTVYSPDGSSTVETPGFPERPKIDCFYVYPTVSEDPGANSDREIDEEEVAVARYQAARFSHRCRVYAPVYRQRTLGSIAAGSEESQAQALQIAYGDVRAAFLDYLENHNRGRGFVLIGHSQGTTMLRQLVRDLIDRDRKLRRRLVSALLLGNDVIVREGKRAGGDFRNVPACTSRRQIGCVVAYSTYDETPPPSSRFARPDPPSPNPFGFPSGPGYEVLCNNPAALAGGPAQLQNLVRSEPYPGVIGALLVIMYGGPPPSAPTPWLQPRDRYIGECRSEDGADWLHLSPVGDAQDLNPSPDRNWGLHLADVNIALGDLVELVRLQKRAYVRAQRRG